MSRTTKALTKVQFVEKFSRAFWTIEKTNKQTSTQTNKRKERLELFSKKGKCMEGSFKEMFWVSDHVHTTVNNFINNFSVLHGYYIFSVSHWFTAEMLSGNKTAFCLIRKLDAR